MPKKLERALKRGAKAKGFGKARTQRYVYGYLNKHGLLHHRKGKRKQ
jgi:hypothetical protein